jgi:hypothetical protein
MTTLILFCLTPAAILIVITVVVDVLNPNPDSGLKQLGLTATCWALALGFGVFALGFVLWLIKTLWAIV